jgi:hypothetical protein
MFLSVNRTMRVYKDVENMWSALPRIERERVFATERVRTNVVGDKF